MQVELSKEGCRRETSSHGKDQGTLLELWMFDAARRLHDMMHVCPGCLGGPAVIVCEWVVAQTKKFNQMEYPQRRARKRG